MKENTRFFIRGDPALKILGAGETNSSGERNTSLLAAGYFIKVIFAHVLTYTLCGMIFMY